MESYETEKKVSTFSNEKLKKSDATHNKPLSDIPFDILTKQGAEELCTKYKDVMKEILSK
ncbi:MAG: hypothetical protein LBT30_04025 [Clostridiales bacterium]|jgi:hypothetical protein|nr:hypothetical protein [Clostridiales bacterium]